MMFGLYAQGVVFTLVLESAFLALVILLVAAGADVDVGVQGGWAGLAAAVVVLVVVALAWPASVPWLALRRP